MPELKLDFKNLGPIRLMPLDSASLFLPFGRPIADYLRGVAGSQNGSRASLWQGAMDFTPLIRWTESTAWTMRTTGFGELEREGVVASITPALPTELDPGVADFLPMAPVGPSAPNAAPATIPATVRVEGLTISKPRITALPLRPRMTFGPPPASKVKPVPVSAPAPKPVAPPVAAKPVAVVAPPPKPSPVPAAVPKPVTPVKAVAPTPVQPKPVTVIPTAPRPSATPAPSPRMAPPPAPAVTAPAARVPEAPSAPPVPKPIAAPAPPKINMPAAPAARAAEPSPGPTLKSAPAPAQASAPATPQAKPVAVFPPVAPLARAPEAASSPIVTTASTPASSTPAPAPSAKPVVAPAPPKPPAPSISAGRAPSAPPVEALSRPEAPKPVQAPASRPTAAERSFIPAPEPNLSSTSAPVVEPHLTMGDDRPESLFERIPMPLKIGVVLFVLLVGLYFAFGKSSKSSDDTAGVTVGEQGWSTEQVSDPVGSRHGRQLTIYRPSVGMSDYQLQFVAQIETKAIGWFFRETDTQNYYAMKIENLGPGKMAITHFAVIDGRETGYSQRPLGVDSRPGAMYKVSLDVTGPRFTAYVGGEPVDFWTDNRLKTGAVGFMSERDERGATSAVRFSFPKGGK